MEHYIIEPPTVKKFYMIQKHRHKLDDGTTNRNKLYRANKTKETNKRNKEKKERNKIPTNYNSYEYGFNAFLYYPRTA